MDRRKAGEDRWDLRYGVVASTIINMTYRGKHAKQVSPADIFPTLGDKESAEDALDRFFGVN